MNVRAHLLVPPHFLGSTVFNKMTWKDEFGKWFKDSSSDQHNNHVALPQLTQTFISNPRAHPVLHIAVDRFLLFGRNLLEQSSGETAGDCRYDADLFSWRSGTHNSLAANESDEGALAFLNKHAGNVGRAEFHIASQVSAGTGNTLYPHGQGVL